MHLKCAKLEVKFQTWLMLLKFSDKISIIGIVIIIERHSLATNHSQEETANLINSYYLRTAHIETHSGSVNDQNSNKLNGSLAKFEIKSI